MEGGEKRRAEFVEEITSSRNVVTSEEDVFVNIVDDDAAAQLEAGMRMLPGPSGIVAHGADGTALVFEEAQFLEEEDAADFDLPGQMEPISEEVYEGDEPVTHFLVEDIPQDEYMMFQAEELPSGLMLCKLCKESPLFQTREAFAAHRYRVHGSYTNSLACPDVECNEMFASITVIKRHLITHHEVPLETHYKKFDNQADFNDWVLFVQYATNSRFVLVNRQQPKRRQILYCEYSEHRRTNSTEEQQSMLKPRACCPAHINFQVLNDGSVSVIYQLKHFGHIPDSVDVNAIKPFSLLKPNSEERSRVAFPPSCPIIGYRPMQFVQIDVVPMDAAVYHKNGMVHSDILIITDLFSKFMIARTLINTNEKDSLICRLLMEIFNMFGVPEGYSSHSNSSFKANGFDMVRCMEHISEVFRVRIEAIMTNPPSYLALKQNLESRSETELQNKLRWPEILPSVILTHNQTPHPAFQYKVSPFEVMFGRRAWYKTPPQCELPWLIPYDILETNINVGLTLEEIIAECPSLRKGEGEVPVLDTYGDELSKTLASRVKNLVNMVEQNCDKWETGDAFMPAKDDPYFLEKVGIKNEFIKGDPVLTRNVFTPDRDKILSIKGVIGEVDWQNAPFAYKIHITPHLRANKIPGHWPDENCPSFMMSAFDIAASDNDLHVQRIPNFEQRRANFFCQCSPDCPLIKSDYCIRGLSKTCCDRVGQPCPYHEGYDPSTVSIEKYTELHLKEQEERKKRALNAVKRRKIVRYYTRPVVDRRNGVIEETYVEHPSTSEVDVEPERPYQQEYRIEEDYPYAQTVQEVIPAGENPRIWCESQEIYGNENRNDGIYEEPGMVDHRMSPSSSYYIGGDEFMYDMEMVPGQEEDPKEWVSKLNLRQCASRLRRIELRMNALQARNEDPKSDHELMELDRLARLLRKHWSELQRTAPKSFRVGFSRAFQGISRAPRKRPAEFENYVTTKYVVEEDQVFPLVYQPSEPEMLEQAMPEQIVMQVTQPSRGRGILSRRGPSKKTAQSVRELVSSSNTYAGAEPSTSEPKSEEVVQNPTGFSSPPPEGVRRSARTPKRIKVID